MEDLYRVKDGQAEAFNLVTLALDEDDLAALEADVTEGTLPETTGFSFGLSDGSERKNDLAFIAAAREASRAGACVFYHSWWWRGGAPTRSIRSRVGWKVRSGRLTAQAIVE